MSEEVKQLDMSGWFSTYGSLTAQRILEGFHIKLDHDELLAAINNNRSIYYQLLRVPLKNVFNGIVMQQVHDYQVYVQKLLVDYLLSGQNDKGEDSPGSGARENLKEHSSTIMQLGDELNKTELEHQQLIAESQNILIKIATEIQKSIKAVSGQMNESLRGQNVTKSETEIMVAVRRAFVSYKGDESEMFSNDSAFWALLSKELDISLDDNTRTKFSGVLSEFNAYRNELNSNLSTFLEKAEDIGRKIRTFRQEFYRVILTAKEIIQTLPEYKPDPQTNADNLSALNFDSKIGGE